MKRIALIAAATIALAGCGSGSGRGPHSHPPFIGYTPVVVAANRMSPDMILGRIAQLMSPTRLAIVTTGSSSCPSVPDRLIVDSPHKIRIHLTAGSWERGKLVAHPPPGGVCTADYGTTHMVITINPRHIAVHRPLTVVLSYGGGKKPEVAIAAGLKR